MPVILVAVVGSILVICLSSHISAALTCDSQSPLCLEARGQFAVPNECRKFANCWDFCATFSSCPGTLVFSGEKQRCDFTWNLTPDHHCYKPMANAGGVAGGAGLLSDLPNLPPMNPLFAPGTFSGSGGGGSGIQGMQQGMNPDGTLFQSMGGQQQQRSGIQN
ncbi:hypothetical protein BV898_07158 [Hypsibius exemplaris]|uniref:Chitin-binding type-2 domain-containing protein n=1 Tax=Hypsibius exemplaris TaxID=2072580 RepID=A0A1W0WU26_HYPEX|nr:hypothetical protein BV898_07158 [Hypsibius exemplaris]